MASMTMKTSLRMRFLLWVYRWDTWQRLKPYRRRPHVQFSQFPGQPQSLVFRLAFQLVGGEVAAQQRLVQAVHRQLCFRDVSHGSFPSRNTPLPPSTMPSSTHSERSPIRTSPRPEYIEVASALGEAEHIVLTFPLIVCYAGLQLVCPVAVADPVEDDLEMPLSISRPVAHDFARVDYKCAPHTSLASQLVADTNATTVVDLDGGPFLSLALVGVVARRLSYCGQRAEQQERDGQVFHFIIRYLDRANV